MIIINVPSSIDSPEIKSVVSEVCLLPSFNINFNMCVELLLLVYMSNMDLPVESCVCFNSSRRNLIFMSTDFNIL